jgi:histidine triad (HIT) family protein
MDCIFCQITEGKIPAPKVLEDENSFVIRDIHPQAKQHYLVIPKQHVASIEKAFEVESDGRATVSNLFSLANRLAKQEGLLPNGFRSVINTNEYGGQTVHHLHLHILGGEQLRGSFGS